ncbi:MAG: hypothetical protein LC645_07965 [Geobacteraceae bacterium]|nr:hypothetical protein [Geobacteraceae bacterium]
MEFFVPVQPAAFSVNPVTPSQKSADAVQHNLQPYQVVQATIAEKGDGRVLLDMDGKQMWAQSKADVKTGQQLNLQVTKTEPVLQLRVVPQGVEKYLLRLLHLFDHKPELGARLQQISQHVNDKNANQQLQQLAQQFLGQRTFPGGADLTRVATPLQESLTQLLQADPGDSTSPTTPLTSQTQQILSPFLQTQAGTKPTPEGLQQLQNMLMHMAKFSASPATPDTMAINPSGSETSHLHALTASVLQSLAQTLGNIQQHIATPPPRELALLAQILGLNFEGRLLNGEVEQARNSLKGMLLQLKGQEDTSAQVRENSTNLLQQLELFQLCRGRLAQDGILFLPLPYDFLQQGYALIEEYGDKEGTEGEEKGKNLSVTLNLALKNLGAINIHMLFEQEKLFVRISCAEPQTTALVENTRTELDTILLPLGLQRLNIDANGKDPAVALLGRLSPDKSVLDARV